MSAVHMIADDEILSLGDSSDLSFVGENMDDFFNLETPALESANDSSAPQQSPFPTSWSQAPQSKEPPMKSSAPMQSPLIVKMQSGSTAAASLQRDCPRMVSVDSMSQVSASPRKEKACKATPLQSLKELVSNRQKQQGTVGLKRSAPLPSLLRHSGTESRIASVFHKPSLVLQKIVEQTEQQQTKRRKLDPEALHQACRRSNVTVQEVEAILAQDPQAASRPVTLETSKSMYDPVSDKVQEKKVPEAYKYPLNLAIKYQASAPVLERLVAAAPSILTTKEGKDQLTPLHVLLRHKTDDDVSADMMLLKHPDIAGIADVKHNTPLHQAVSRGASEQMVRHLVVLNPEALMQRNFHRNTPLDLAQRAGGMASSAVVDYLWEQVQDQF